MLSHSDTVSAILRNRTISPVPAHLEEIALLTGVISRAAGWNSLSDDSSAAIEIRSQLSRLEQITLNLLPVCILGKSYFPRMSSRNLRSFAHLGETSLADLGLDPNKLTLKITVNILKLARSLTGQNRVVFAPSFERPNKSNLSLGILTKILYGTSNLMVSAQEKSEICRRRLDSIQDLTTQQLVELLPEDTDEKLPAQVRRMIGAKTLGQELKNWDELLELCSLVLESTTWLLWHHMEYYLSKKPLALGGQGASLSIDDFTRLKREASTHLSAILYKKLNECEQVHPFVIEHFISLTFFSFRFTYRKKDVTVLCKRFCVE